MDLNETLETSILAMMTSVSDYVTTRDGIRKKSLAEQVEIVNDTVVSLAGTLSTAQNPRTALAASMLKDLSRKLGEITDILERLNPERSLYQSLDVPHMTGRVVSGISDLVACITGSCQVDMERLVEDMHSLRQVQEQYSRILLTYIVQDGKNMSEVLALLGFAESCRHLGEDITSMINYLETVDAGATGLAS